MKTKRRIYAPWSKGWLLGLGNFYVAKPLKAASDLDYYLAMEAEKEGVTNHPAMTSVQAILYADAGDTNKMDERIRVTLLGEPKMTHFHHAWYQIGCACALVGDEKRAVEYLEHAAKEGFPCYPWFRDDPTLNNIRGKPLFDDFLHKQKTDWEKLKASLSL